MRINVLKGRPAQQRKHEILIKSMQMYHDLIKTLIEIRTQLKLSQEELTELTGIRQPVISRIETCASNPQLYTLLKLIVAYQYKVVIVPMDFDIESLLSDF